MERVPRDKQDVLLRTLDIVEGHGAECAFPTSTVHLFTASERDETAGAAAGPRPEPEPEPTRAGPEPAQ